MIILIKISGTTIAMTRGDTLRVVLELKDENDNTYVPQSDDRIRFAMKKFYDDETPLVIKEIPNDTLELVLEPEDTKHLPQPSSYVYDIQIIYANGDIDTFIDRAKLKLTEEVH